MYWLKAYARKLADEGRLDKAKELCLQLSVNDENTETVDAYSLPSPNRSKHDLLREILPILSKNGSFQRILAPFNDILGEMVIEC